MTTSRGRPVFAQMIKGEEAAGKVKKAEGTALV